MSGFTGQDGFTGVNASKVGAREHVARRAVPRVNHHRATRGERLTCIIGAEREAESLLITASSPQRDELLDLWKPKVLRVWDVVDLAPRLEIQGFAGDASRLHFVEFAGDDPTLLVECTKVESEFELWSLSDGRLLAGPAPGYEVIGVIGGEREPLIVGARKTARFITSLRMVLQATRIRRRLGNSRKQTRMFVREAVAGTVRGYKWSRPIDIHGRLVVASACGNHARVWDIAELLEQSRPDGADLAQEARDERLSVDAVAHASGQACLAVGTAGGRFAVATRAGLVVVKLNRQ